MKDWLEGEAELKDLRDLAGRLEAAGAKLHEALRQSRQRELEVLTSAAAREALGRRGIQLISYREL